MDLDPVFGFKPEKMPHLALAQLLVGIVSGEVMITSQQRRMLISRFSEVLREVTQATSEAYEEGYDAGYLKGKPEEAGSDGDG